MLLRRKAERSSDRPGTQPQCQSPKRPPSPSSTPLASFILRCLRLLAALAVLLIWLRLQSSFTEEDYLISKGLSNARFVIKPLQVWFDADLTRVKAVDASELPDVYEEVIEHGGYAPDWDQPDPEDQIDGCHFQNQQHSRLFQSCPPTHEVNLMEISFIHCGGTRCAFHFPDSGPGQQEVVLKVQKFKKDYKPKRLEKSRMDGLIMEQGTSSPYIANIYASCGTAQVLEYSSKGTQLDLVKIARQAQHDPMKPIDKLKVLIHIASAITDLHDKGANHGDLRIDQFLFLEGVYKLNDFHISAFLQQGADRQTCLDDGHFSMGDILWHAPEQKDGKEADLTLADVFMMGNAMFNIYTKRWVYEGIKEQHALALLYHGKYSEFPPTLDTTIPANKAMQSAILKCWTQDPQQRPSAKSIRDSLLQELSSIVGRTVQADDNLLKIQIPPLPKYHTYSGSSMDNANENERKPLEVQFNNQQ